MSDNNLDFHLNDAYFREDDDFQYAVFNGREAEEIIIPVELTEDSSEPQPSQTVPSLSEKKEKPRPVVRDIPSLLSLAEEYTELLGAETIRVLTFIFSRVYSILAIPFMIIVSLFSRLLKRLKAIPGKIHISLADDIKKIGFELKAIFSAGKKVESRKTQVILKALYKYFIISFRRHRHFWKTIFNLALPTVCLMLLFGFWNVVYNNSTFALEVFYNGTSLGYVENADVFEQGRSRALSLIATGDEQQASLSKPVYKVRRIRINELSNSKAISESILQTSGENYTRACGVYIDGEFICAVTNEADAMRVFDSILAPYKRNAAPGTIVDFVEEIEYAQGYYSENSDLIWDTEKLTQTLSQPKTKRQYHKLKKGEVLTEIAKKYSISVSQLKAMNPASDFSVGSKLLVSQESSYVRVKTMKTRTKTQLIAYETIERNSSSLLKGTKKTSQEGSYGQKLITELVTYIDGKETYSTVVSERITKNPVNKIILIGTKTVTSTPGYSNPGTSTGRFIWPTVGAYTISSYYGYRNPSISGWGWHGGIDIIRAGGNSTGIPVVAAGSGTVISAVRGYSGYGHTVVISHGNGLTTRYAHMQPGSLNVYVGQYVYQGQQIGRIGSTGNSTGPHLHFEVLLYGAKKNPLNYIRR